MKIIKGANGVIDVHIASAVSPAVKADTKSVIPKSPDISFHAYPFFCIYIIAYPRIIYYLISNKIIFLDTGFILNIPVYVPKYFKFLILIFS